MNTATIRQQTTAPYVENIERLSDEELVATMLAQAANSVACVNWEEFPYSPSVTFRLAFSKEALAIMFQVSEENVRAVTLEPHGPVWEDSCVEFFVKNPKGEGYFNFEINCIGSLLAAFRLSRNEAQPFDKEQMERVRHFGSLAHQPIDLKGQQESWWMVEVIPFELLGLEEAPSHIDANFYKCGDKCEKAHFLSWSPIALPEPNFHCPEFFGRVELTR